MESKTVYYIIPNGEHWDVIREGEEKFGSFLGTHMKYEWALEVVDAYIAWTGGTLYDS